MKVKLPFVVQPRYAPKKILVGSDESGKFEIERRGYLSVSEKSFVQIAMKEAGTTSMLKVVGLIARQENKKQAEVIKDLQNYDPAGGESYLDKYEEELLSLSGEMEQATNLQRLAQTTALMISRYDSSWEFQDTLELHPDIVDDLSKLYVDEEAKSIEDLIDEEEAGPSTEGADKSDNGKVSKEEAKAN